MPTSHGNARYARQLSLPGFGPEQQQRLADAHVCCVGAGGLGSPALLYLVAAQVVPLLVGSAINVAVAVIAGIALAAAGLAGRPVLLTGPGKS